MLVLFLILLLLVLRPTLLPPPRPRIYVKDPFVELTPPLLLLQFLLSLTYLSVSSSLSQKKRDSIVPIL
jgi:hypothetical protein